MAEKVTFETLSLQELKKARTEYLTVTGLVIARPCFILDWEMSAKTNGTGIVTVYDGVSVGSPPRMAFRWVKDTTIVQNYTFPRYFSTGLYIVLGGDVLSVTVHYLPEPA